VNAHERAVRAVYASFLLNGAGVASLLSRVPQIRDALHLRPGPLGLLLLVGAIGSLVSLPLAGSVVHRFGSARTAMVMSVTWAIGLAIVAIGTRVGTPIVGIGLFIAGFGAGQWDVAQNVEGAAVEQGIGRSIMSRFHAAFSIGTVIGALGGAAMNALHVDPIWHLLTAAAVIGIGVPWQAHGFVPAGTADEDRHAERHDPWKAWTERRTLLIGLFVLCMAFSEGTGNDWLGVAAIDGYHASAALGSFAYVAFVAAMTTGRWFGPRVLDRYGRVTVLRTSALCALVGVVTTVYGPALGTAIVGVLLWGLGSALGFPTGISAAADDPARSAGRVSTVATIGYAAFLAGPSLIGTVGNHIGVLRALAITAAVLALGAVLASTTRPLQPEIRVDTATVPPTP
jgi:predicted MFS family arabinose efflux permease